MRMAEADSARQPRHAVAEAVTVLREQVGGELVDRDGDDQLRRRPERGAGRAGSRGGRRDAGRGARFGAKARRGRGLGDRRRGGGGEQGGGDADRSGAKATIQHHRCWLHTVADDGIDTAVYVSSSREVTIINNGAEIYYDDFSGSRYSDEQRRYTVITASEGTDVLFGIEYVKLSDKTISLANLVHTAKPGIVVNDYGSAGVGFCYVPDVDPTSLPSPARASLQRKHRRRHERRWQG